MRRAFPISLLILSFLILESAPATTLLRPSPQFEQLEKLVDHSGDWNRAVGPISNRYALSLLEGLENLRPWQEEMKQALETDLSHALWRMGESHLSLAMETGTLFARSEPIRLLQIAAFANPLMAGNGGMFTDDGGLGFIGSRIHGHLSEYFSFRASPYAAFSTANSLLDDSAEFYLREAMGAFHIGELVLEGGLGTIRWGNGRIGNMLFSGEHKPPLLARIRSRSPFVPPGFLKFLGPTQFETFISFLDEDGLFPHTRLFGLLFSFRPHPRFEFGYGQTVIFGGSGAPTNSPAVIVADALVNASNPANRNFLFTAKWRIPKIEIEPYFELVVEDCCELPGITARDTMNLVGLYLPALDPEGRADFTLEWVRTNHISYRHGTFTDGYIYKDRTLGHPLGPDGTGIYAQLRYFFSPRLHLKTLFAFEMRGRLERAIQGTDIRTVDSNYESAEHRYRWLTDMAWKWAKNWWVTSAFGLERVNNLNYFQNWDRFQFLFSAGLKYTP